jgi:hypothetical protein
MNKDQPELTEHEIDIPIEDTITIDLSNMGAVGANSAYQYPTYSIGTTAGMNGTSGSYLTSSGTGSTVWTTNTSPWSIGPSSTQPSLQVTGDADFSGDIKWKGRSLGKLLESIEDRLAILQPSPEKLEKYAALKKAYDQYKLMEKLIGED